MQIVPIKLIPIIINSKNRFRTYILLYYTDFFLNKIIKGRKDLGNLIGIP